MGHYIANLRDIEFCLFDLLEREEILGKSIYKDLDRQTSMGMLEEVKRMAENDLAASFVDGDQQGVKFDAAKSFSAIRLTSSSIPIEVSRSKSL